MGDKDISDLVKRYQQMLDSGRSIYFDAEEFDELAEYYDLHEDSDLAKEIVELGLKIHPNNHYLMLKQAKFMVYEKRYKEAFEYLNKHFNGYDFELYLLKIECFLQLGFYEDAEQLLPEILADTDNDGDIVYSELGFLYVEADYYDEAIRFFNESLAINPNNIEVLTELAYANEMKSDFSAAIKINNKILDIDPYSYETWVNIGKLYSLQDQFENAIDAFDFALTIDDSDSDVLKLKAHCLSLCGRSEEAIEIFKEYINENDDEALYQSLLECYFALERYDEMLECLDRYEELKGETTEILAKRAFVYLQMDNVELASKLVEKGTELNPDSEDLLVVDGEIKFYKDNFVEAEPLFQKAYEINNENITVLDRLALIYIWKNEYDKAISFTEQLLAVNPDVEVKIRLALLYFEIGDKERFNSYLDSFTDEELKALLELFFPESNFDQGFVTRETLIGRLNDARDCRQLFKNIQY